jgi:hypothetical protein
MRRIAAYIYKKAGRWKQSIALSKKDNMYKDCMETCSQSGDRELSEDLLVYFIEQVCVEDMFCVGYFFVNRVMRMQNVPNSIIFLDNCNGFSPLILTTSICLLKIPNSSVM